MFELQNLKIKKSGRKSSLSNISHLMGSIGSPSETEEPQIHEIRTSGMVNIVLVFRNIINSDNYFAKRYGLIHIIDFLAQNINQSL